MGIFHITSKILNKIQNNESTADERKKLVINAISDPGEILKGIPGSISSYDFHRSYLDIIHKPCFVVTRVVSGWNEGDLVVEIESLNEAFDLFIGDHGINNLFLGYVYVVDESLDTLVVGAYIKTRESTEWDDFIFEQTELGLDAKLEKAIDNPEPLNIDVLQSTDLAATNGRYLVLNKEVYDMPYKSTDKPLDGVPLELFKRDLPWVYLKPDEAGGFEFAKEAGKTNEDETQV